MNVFAKLYATCITSKLENISNEKKLRADIQCGFRAGYCLDDHCTVLKTVIYQGVNINKPVFLLFVDLRKAYDSVPREILWQNFSE